MQNRSLQQQLVPPIDGIRGVDSGNGDCMVDKAATAIPTPCVVSPTTSPVTGRVPHAPREVSQSSIMLCEKTRMIKKTSLF